MSLAPDSLCLLWPRDIDPSLAGLDQSQDWVQALLADLSVQQVVSAMRSSYGYPVETSFLLQLFTQDPAVIDYRLAVLADLLRLDSLRKSLGELLPLIQTLDQKQRPWQQYTHWEALIQRIHELDTYVECMLKLSACLEKARQDMQAAGLLDLDQTVKAEVESQEFQRLKTELPKMKKKLESVGSVTLGINLDSYLQPKEAILLSVSEHQFKSGTLMDRLLKRSSDDPQRGISPLQPFRRGSNKKAEQENIALERAILGSLERVLRRVVKPIAPILKEYTDLNSQALNRLAPEISCYLGMTHLITELQNAGLPMCRPTTLPMETRRGRLTGFFNIALGLQMARTPGIPSVREAMVSNDIEFGERALLFVLTGPNRGGKTTFVQAIGLVQLLYQLGCYVPAEQAELSPCDQIFSHFPVQEQPMSNLGRMGEECSRLGTIFERVTPYSMVLLNESLSSTSPGEGLFVAREVLESLRIVGARTIFATHFHELAEAIEELNAHAPFEHRVMSLVAGIDASAAVDTEDFSRRTYKIQPGPPLGTSYAREIARKHGVSKDQILTLLDQRGVLSSDQQEAGENSTSI